MDRGTKPVIAPELARPVDGLFQPVGQFAEGGDASGDEVLARDAVECREMLRRVRDGLPE